MDSNQEPYSRRYEGDGGFECGAELVEAGREAPVILQPIESALDPVSLPVQVSVFAWALAVGAPAGNDRRQLLVIQPGTQLVAIVSLVGDQRVCLQRRLVDEFPGGYHVVALAGGQAEPAQPAVLVADAMALRGAAPARAADRLRLGALGTGESPFSAPAAARCAGTTVVSIISRLLGWRC